MYLQIAILILIFFLSLVLIMRNFRQSLVALLILSVLLHKELFSIYHWDLLPVRVFMLALLVSVAVKVGIWKLKIYRETHSVKAVSSAVAAVFFANMKDPFILTLVLLWVVRAISLFFTKSWLDSIQLFGFFTTIVVLGVLIYQQFRSDAEGVLKFIRIYTYIVFGLSSFAYFQMLLYFKFGILVGAFWSIPNNIPRVGSLFWDVNHFGALLASILPILGILIILGKTWKSRIMHALMFLSMSGILLLTNSRTAWIIFACAILTFALTLLMRKFGMKALAGMLIAILLVILPVFLEYSRKDSPFRAKIRDYLNYRMDSFDSHFLLITGTIQIFEKYPVFGGGYGGFFEHFKYTEIAPTYFSRDPAGLTNKVPAHTIWGETIAETGIVGLTVYVLLFAIIISSLFYAALFSRDRKITFLSAAMASSIVGLMFGGIFYSYNAEFFWLIVFMYFAYGVSASGLVTSGRFSLSKLLGYFRSYSHIPLFIIIGLSAYLIFIGLGANHLIPWDEAIYAKIAKNMVTSGNYLVQYWAHGKVWYEKPPLSMWLQAFSMDLLGFNSLGARLPSALFGLGTVIVTFLFARRFFNKTAAFFSAFALVTTFQFLYYARSAMLDVSVTFFITLSLYLYWLAKESLGDKRRLLLWILAGVSAGLGIMVKGVVGFVPFAIILIFELFCYAEDRKQITKKVLLNNLFGYLVFGVSSLVIFVPWHYEMYKIYGQAFINNYILYHVVDRATSAIEDKGRPFFWYLEVMKVSMRLWFIVLLGAFPFAVFTAVFKKSKKHIFLLIWTLFVFFLFSISVSKLVWYITPIYPAVCIIVGYFAEKVLGWLMKSLPIANNVLFKTLFIYIVVVGVLFYLFENRELVYTSDLSGPKATMLELKAQTYPPTQVLYIDSVEYPLSLFYAGEPFVDVDFRGLRKVIMGAGYTDKIVFVTKESRYLQIEQEIPQTNLIGQEKEWVLAEVPTQLDLDKAQDKLLRVQVNEVTGRISASKLAGRRPSGEDIFLLQQLQGRIDLLNTHIATELDKVAKEAARSKSK